MYITFILFSLAVGLAVYILRFDADLLLYSSMTLMGISIYFITNSFMTEEEQYKASEKLDDAEVAPPQNLGIILKYSRPFFKRYVSPIVSSMKNKNKIKERYKRSLASAGLTNDLNPYDFYSFKLFLILGFPVVFVFLKFFLETDWPLSAVIPFSVFGYYYPNIWLKGQTQGRQKQLVLNMPFAVDMLALSVEAGLDFVAAMQKVIEKAPPNPLVSEFEITLKEIKVGASRAEALRNLAWRTDLMVISSFTATLIAADSVGASIGPILKTLSGEIRQKRSADAEQEGAKAATKILLPMIFFIIPSVFIVIAAPIALEMIYK